LDISFPPPDHILKDPDFDRLLFLAFQQMILVNDMYSFRHEAFGLGSKTQQLRNAGENCDLQDAGTYYVYNAICILLREDDVDETNVMEKLGAHISRRESEFMATAEKLKARFKDRTNDLNVIQVWVDILTQWTAGNCYWSNMCRRYSNFNDLGIDN
jgi:hypothetical protein